MEIVLDTKDGVKEIVKMYVSENDRPATTEEINKFLEEENHNKNEEIKSIRSKLFDVESEMHRYKTAFKLLVKELQK
jgi:hypothetical protein